MLDSDLTLVLNAPDLVDLYANEPLTWRQHFDAAYIKMGELGNTGGLTNPDAEIEAEITVGSSQKASKRSRDIDDEHEFFQNLNLLREKQLSLLMKFMDKPKKPMKSIKKSEKAWKPLALFPTMQPKCLQSLASFPLDISLSAS